MEEIKCFFFKDELNFNFMKTLILLLAIITVFFCLFLLLDGRTYYEANFHF
jgi:hypothetical protein